MPFLYNIRSIAKYESKLLLRSWFFRIFTILYLIILFFQNLVIFFFAGMGGGVWAAKAIESNIPYMNLLLVNSGQAIIAIFLASDFMKRDNKMDTSEVFYVHPLSNAEYIIGKIWGNLRVFLIFNLIVMAMALIFNIAVPHVSIDWMAYPAYFLLISIPTLIYIIGLSIFLMSLFRNQSLTFILLLGYIGLTLFYLVDKYHFLFDYMTYHFPLLKSSVIGFTNLGHTVAHRMIYLFAGIAFMFLTIVMFKRLPNSKRNNYRCLFLALVSFFISGSAAFKYVNDIKNERNLRTEYTSLNNKYVHSPKLAIETYAISMQQQTKNIQAEVKMKGIALQTASVFTFCLNPGLQVLEITRENAEILSFDREQQIILVDMGKEMLVGDTVALSIKYTGKISNSFCYLDIPDEELEKNDRLESFSSDKQYCFQTDNYLLFTPESYWYPRPGTAYSNTSSDWQQTYFSQFSLNFKPLPGLVPVSQGESIENADGSYSFVPEHPVQAISLVAGKYKQHDIVADGIQYSIRYIDGHDYYSASFKAIQDTLPSVIRDFKEGVERQYKLDYPFKRFSIVEVPAQFAFHRHVWSNADENVQPEMLFVEEKGWRHLFFDVEGAIKNNKRQSIRGMEISDENIQIQVLSDIYRQYSFFPQLYNFRFNVFSPEWPAANLIVESYLQGPKEEDRDVDFFQIIQRGGSVDFFELKKNGISNAEKANLLVGKQGFKDLLSNASHRKLLDYFIDQRANQLFSPCEINMGVNVFRDSVLSVLKQNPFRNIQFEDLLDSFGEMSRTDIRTLTAGWDQPVSLPYYIISEPEITQFTDKGKDVFVLKLTISNESGYDGIVYLKIQESKQQQLFNSKSDRKIKIPAHQCMQLVSLWDEAPKEVKINTMVSNNIPSVIKESLSNIRREKGTTTDIEGDYIVSSPFVHREDEIIVDNEDPLFSISDPIVVGLLPKWMNIKADTTFRYPGISQWRQPLQWTAVVSKQYYGKNIRSAYAVKSGKGDKTATWKASLPSPGNYEVYYYVYKDDQLKSSNTTNMEYHFKIQCGEDTEDTAMNVNKTSGSGWEQIGVYYFSSDTVSITLTNEFKWRTVYADAVKIVKR
jgi:ABC-type transport system involved in multi-copper enzyme maturation permease subunit